MKLNNKVVKFIFIVQWLFLLLFFIVMKIGFPGGDGSGKSFFVGGPFIFVFILLWIIHIIGSAIIEKDRTDKSFLVINLAWPIILFVLRVAIGNYERIQYEKTYQSPKVLNMNTK